MPFGDKNKYKKIEAFSFLQLVESFVISTHANCPEKRAERNHFKPKPLV